MYGTEGRNTAEAPGGINEKMILRSGGFGSLVRKSREPRLNLYGCFKAVGMVE